MAEPFTSPGHESRHEDDHEQATHILEEGVTLSEQMRDRANLSYFLEGLAMVAGAQELADRSTCLFGAAERLMETFEAAWAEGRAMTLEKAVAYALEDDEASPT